MFQRLSLCFPNRCPPSIVPPSLQTRWRLILWAPLLSLSVAVVAPWRVGLVSGSSMSPTYRSGDAYILERPDWTAPKIGRGDVVVFDHDGTTYVKRILATEGHVIWLLHTKQTDLKPALVMDYQLPKLRQLRNLRWWSKANRLVPLRVPIGHLFVVGDNLEKSVDSRDFGPIPVSSLRGKVWNAPEAPDEVWHIAGHYRWFPGLAFRSPRKAAERRQGAPVNPQRQANSA